jgi:precorrin-2/cobalt-factor-2 C20-methyltransferase
LFHSTFAHVLSDLPDDFPVEIVPGVSSMNAAAAQVRLPLVNAHQRLAVIPATFEDEAGLRQVLGELDTVVLLKFNRELDRLLDLLDELGLIADTVMVERATHARGRVIRDVSSLRGQPVHYLSLLIVKADRDERPARDRAGMG